MTEEQYLAAVELSDLMKGIPYGKMTRADKLRLQFAVEAMVYIRQEAEGVRLLPREKAKAPDPADVRRLYRYLTTAPSAYSG